MPDNQSLSEIAKLTNEQVKEGYRVEKYENNVLVWHGRNQIALLLFSPDINRKVHDVIERRRKELKEVEELFNAL